ncbi:MAG: hypothetical protein EOO05_13055 [Chitinophagaceae bacterium]|nr:MAG: hypothetical protein EOO05_13055 [Chitinophagaceae bacterium]
MFKFTLVIWIELICLVICTASLWSSRQWWRLFIWFMLLTVLTEVTGFLYYFHINPGHSNEWVYNTYLPLEMAFKALVLARIMGHYGIKRYWFAGAYILLFAFWLYEGYSNGFVRYNAMSNLSGSILIVICCCLFYYRLLRAREYVDLPRYPPFWIISGLFIFYFGSTGLNAFVVQLQRIYASTGIPIRFIIMVVLNFILYACWSYAFLCIKRNRISLSQSSLLPRSS